MNDPSQKPDRNLSEHPTVLPSEVSRDAATAVTEAPYQPISERQTELPSEQLGSAAAPVEPAVQPAGQLLAGRYRIFKELGKGGKAGKKNGQPDREALLKRFDTNGDGQLSDEERQAMRKALQDRIGPKGKKKAGK